jgi:hypothetical protein
MPQSRTAAPTKIGILRLRAGGGGVTDTVRTLAWTLTSGRTGCGATGDDDTIGGSPATNTALQSVHWTFRPVTSCLAWRRSPHCGHKYWCDIVRCGATSGLRNRNLTGGSRLHSASVARGPAIDKGPRVIFASYLPDASRPPFQAVIHFPFRGRPRFSCTGTGNDGTASIGKCSR